MGKNQAEDRTKMRKVQQVSQKKRREVGQPHANSAVTQRTSRTLN